MNIEAHDVLSFWFGSNADGMPNQERMQLWFFPPEGTDELITGKFATLHQRATRGELDDWLSSPEGRLAAILLIDQFSRNIHRGSAEAFAHDHRALAWCKEGIARGDDRQLNLAQRSFFYLPLEHSEALEDQDQSVACFQQLVDEHAGEARTWAEGGLKYAVEHRDIIVQFGRYPHRNDVLGRESTPEEIAYLADGAQTFGQ